MKNKDMIEIRVTCDGVWLEFIGVNAAISMNSIIRKVGPIVARELEKWVKMMEEPKVLND